MTSATATLWTPPVLKTERLMIRPFAVTDLAAVHAYASAYPASGYGSWLGANTPEEVARYLTDTIARYGRPQRTDLGVTLDRQLIGGVGFRQVWISPPAMEIGWVLHPEVTGKGLAREAISLLLTWLFDHFPDMARAEARVRATDTRGAHILAGLGFEREGILRSDTGPDDATHLYGLLRSAFHPLPTVPAR